MKMIFGVSYLRLYQDLTNLWRMEKKSVIILTSAIKNNNLSILIIFYILIDVSFITVVIILHLKSRMFLSVFIFHKI
jgi:hypothetical protein